MNFFKKLFGVNQQNISNKNTSIKASITNKFYERDNIGLRHETQGEGESYFFSLFSRDPESILFYFFDSKELAEKALEKLPCIHIAQDSRKFICTKMITFGVFPAINKEDKSVWSALLAGQNLTNEIWNLGKASFINYGGKMRREEKIDNVSPKKMEINTSNEKTRTSVTFIKKENTILSGFPATNEIYEASSRSDAIEFLKDKIVTQNSYFIIVNTPEGRVAKDIQGIFD
jgi:hypothetical protein